MSWPGADKSERWVDWSFFQNHGGVLRRPFNVDEFCAAHPEVDGAIIRAVWPNGTKDKHYDHYYDGFSANGKNVAAYLWPNPQKSFPAMIEDWRRALGARMPPLLGYDYEEVATFAGKSKAQITSLMKTVWEGVHQEFPNQVHINYSRAGWIEKWIIEGPWFHEIKWWLAHWIFPPPDFSNQANHWQEIDALLPIDNGFTPYRGRALVVRQENVGAWQIGSRGEIVPRGFSDMDYFLKSFVDPIYANDPVPPIPPPSGETIPFQGNLVSGKITVRING